MVIKIPSQTKTISQLNKGDLLGTLFSTRNIDLNIPGLLTLAQRTRYLGQTSSGDFTDVLAIVYGNFQSTTTTFQYWLISSGAVFNVSDSLGNFAVDGIANTPVPGFGGDGCVWNGNLYVTKPARVSKLAAGTWTASFSSADFANTASGFPHPIEPNVTNLNLLIGDGNLLKKVVADGTISIALTLPSDYKIIWIRRGIGTNYIGLDSNAGGRGAVAEWDGLDTTLEANKIIPINARTPVSGVMDDSGVLNIFTSDGRLERFNGSGFNLLAELPVFRDYLLRRDWGFSSAVGGRTLQRGMCMIRGKIHLTISNSISGTPQAVPQFPGGVWVYDDDNKAFYHKFSPSNANSITDFGQFLGTRLGSAIFPVLEGVYTDPTASVGGVLLFGARVFGATVATGYREVLSVTTGENRGQFETCRIESQKIADNGIALWCKYQGLNASTDKIAFKYRTKYRTPIVLTDTQAWTSGTVFTTTDVQMASAEVGDEITILFGNGAGQTAHITSIVLETGTYTVTVDETMTGISSTNSGQIMILNYKKLTPIILYTDTEGQRKISLNGIANKTWFQIKGELRGEGGVVAIQELQIVTQNQLPAE